MIQALPASKVQRLERDQQLLVMAEYQLADLKRVIALKAQKSHNKQLVKRQQSDEQGGPARKAQKVMHQGSNGYTGSMPADVATALAQGKAQVARASQADWDNPYAASVWGEAVAEDLLAATKKLEAALTAGAGLK
jgi:hypothetical protein